MLDTIILSLSPSDFDILDSGKFTPNADLVLKADFLGKCSNKPKNWKTDYMPRLYLYRRLSNGSIQIELRIEFSAPKLMFGNNLDELAESDFENLIVVLHQKLLARGVVVKVESLKNAAVISFHVSKNIRLSGGLTATAVIRELDKIKHTKRLDSTKTDYKNQGQSKQIYCNSYSLVIYDKVADLSKACKRAIDKENTLLQASLSKLIEKQRGSGFLEVLRIELRLSRKAKMNSVLRHLGYTPNPTLKDIFNVRLCESVLVYFWDEMVARDNQFVLLQSNGLTDVEKLFENIVKMLNVKPKEAIYLLGLALAVNGKGVMWLRAVLEEQYGKKSWRRLFNSLKLLNTLTDSREARIGSNIFTVIRNQLADYTALRKEQLFDLGGNL